jgi:hypothetical protein
MRAILATIVCLLMAGAAWAQAPQQDVTIHELEPTGRGVLAPVEDPQLKMMLFDLFDAAGDGVITREEFEQGAEITIDARQFDLLDRNDDGVIDRQEFMDVMILLEDPGMEREMGIEQERMENGVDTMQPGVGTEDNATVAPR